ncbi:sulfatase-like hydrolase/transferase [Calycomorphotria hydatis]|nr:sulfatase-like hydrolase/transferase [Calycomorphotria hydatis]
MTNTLRLLLTVSCLFFATVGTAAEKPNILFVFADDMTYEAIGSADILDIDTPHLDRLAKQSVTFTHAYNMGGYHGAICVASRTMLLTGRSLWDTMKVDSKNVLQREKAAGVLWPQLLKSAGYHTYMTGKWHIKIDPNQIFDEVRDVRPGMPNQTEAGYNRPKDQADYENGWKPWDEQYDGFWKGGKHWSEIVADHGVDYLEQAKEDAHPFFMYLAFNAPHDPRQSPKSYVDRYPLSRVEVPNNFLPVYPHYKEIGCPPSLRDEKLAPFPRTEFAVKVHRQEYFAIVTHMDDQIGRILDTLEATGKADNTYICFTADHGLAVGHHGLIGKQNMYDHSVRVPFLLSGPGLQAGKKITAPIYLQDIMPTTLQLAGVAVPEHIFFHSLLPLLNGEKSESYDEIYGAYTGQQRMITRDGWKLIAYPTIGVGRLYHIAEDPFEQHDLADNSEYAAKREELYNELLKLSSEFNDPLDYEHPVNSWSSRNKTKADH